MTRLFLFILALNLLAFSCKKKETETPQPEEPKDEIVYKAFTPEINIQSVRSFTNYTSACAYVAPFPNDSTSAYDLDVNADQVADFRITVSHNQYTGSDYCGHCPTYQYYVIIKGLLPENTVAVQNNYPGTKIFKESEVINKDNTWTNSLPLRFQECKMSWDFSDGYVGFKMGEDLGYIHIKRLATNGLQVLGSGLNKTDSRSIKCGQK